MDASKMRPGTPPAPGSDFYTDQVAAGADQGGKSGRIRPEGTPAMVGVLLLGALAAVIGLRAGFRGFVITV